MKLKLIIVTGLVPVISALANAQPTVRLRSVPPNASNGAVILPVLQADKEVGGYDLDQVSISYSYDNTNWTPLVSTSSPTNPQFIPAGSLGITQTGTLYIKGEAIDTASNAATPATAQVTVTSGNGTPSLLAAVESTYNYGPAWMYEAGTSTHKVWWTSENLSKISGADVDAIRYSAVIGAPPGQSASTQVLTRNSANDGLLSNPTVIKTPISSGGHTYSYAMYFVEGTGTSALNAIGMTLSDDGVSWTTPTKLFDSDYSTGFGTCFPSVMRIRDNYGATIKFVMFYTDEDDANDLDQLKFRTSTDGKTWSGATNVTHSGLYNWGNIAADGRFRGHGVSVAYYGGYYYMSYVPLTGTYKREEIYVYKIQADTTGSYAPTGSWSSAGLSLPYSTSFQYKHNTGIGRDEDGYLPSGGIAVGFAGENNVPGTNEFILYYFY